MPLRSEWALPAGMPWVCAVCLPFLLGTRLTSAICRLLLRSEDTYLFVLLVFRDQRGQGHECFGRTVRARLGRQRSSAILGEGRRQIPLPFVKFVEMSPVWRRRKALTQAGQHGWAIS